MKTRLYEKNLRARGTVVCRHNFAVGLVGDVEGDFIQKFDESRNVCGLFGTVVALPHVERWDFLAGNHEGVVGKPMGAVGLAGEAGAQGHFHRKIGVAQDRPLDGRGHLDGPPMKTGLLVDIDESGVLVFRDKNLDAFPVDFRGVLDVHVAVGLEVGPGKGLGLGGVDKEVEEKGGKERAKHFLW